MSRNPFAKIIAYTESAQELSDIVRKHVDHCIGRFLTRMVNVPTVVTAEDLEPFLKELRKIRSHTQHVGIAALTTRCFGVGIGKRLHRNALIVISYRNAKTLPFYWTRKAEEMFRIEVTTEEVNRGRFHPWRHKVWESQVNGAPQQASLDVR